MASLTASAPCPCGSQPCPKHAGDIRRYRCGPARRIQAFGRTSGVDTCHRFDRALHLCLHLALCRHRPRCRQPRSGRQLWIRPALSPLPLQCLRSYRDDADMAARGRKQPADYAGHRVHSRVADGWVYSGSHRLGNRMVSVHPYRLYGMGHVDL